MADYTFRNLSGYEFERLARDLLEAEWKFPLETFPSGPDGGVDLRGHSPEGDLIVVQCKQYASSGYAALKSAVRRELSRLPILGANSYRLVTSVPLTSRRRLELFNLLKPFVLSELDIIGPDALNRILTRHPEIEQRHIKLWLASKPVLDAVLHADVLGRSSALLSRWNERAQLYVETTALQSSLDRLRSDRICIISGPPGIGKTTLAEMLCIKYAMASYQIVAVSSDITEAERLFVARELQVFFYDDFLGSTTTAEHLNKNEDARIASFIDRTRADPGKVFLMTTREYILQDAMTRYERLMTAGVDIYKFVLTLSSYSVLQRAQILNNHLFHSHLAETDIKSVTTPVERFDKLIGHANYSPRLIQYTIRAADATNQADRSPIGDELLENFDNPDRLWQHLFEYQLSDTERAVLLVVASFGGEVRPDELLRAVGSHSPRLFGQHGARRLRETLKRTDGTFTRILPIYNGGTLVSFDSPSIQDYVFAYLAETPDELEHLIETSVSYEQARLFFHMGQRPSDELANVPAAYRRLSERLNAISELVVASVKSTCLSPSVSIIRHPSTYPLAAAFPTSTERNIADTLGEIIAEGAFDAEWWVQALHVLRARIASGLGFKEQIVELVSLTANLPGTARRDALVWIEEAVSHFCSTLVTPRDFAVVGWLFEVLKEIDFDVESRLKEVRATFRTWLSEPDLVDRMVSSTPADVDLISFVDDLADAMRELRVRKPTVEARLKPLAEAARARERASMEPRIERNSGALGEWVSSDDRLRNEVSEILLVRAALMDTVH